MTSAHGPQVDMRADAAKYRLDDPGVGLRNNGRRVLTYADLFRLGPRTISANLSARSNCT